MSEKTFKKMYSKEEIKAIANDSVVTPKTGCRRMWTKEEIKAIAGENKPSGNTLSAYFTRNQITEIGPKDFDPSQTVIGQYLFANQSNLERIILPDSITTIKNEMFENCTSLKSITIPDSVTSIEYEAFNNCTSLASITIKNQSCVISNSSYTISSTATIYGYANSTAQSYAEKYNRTFIEITE